MILLAGFVFLHFAATIRSVLGSAEATVGGSVQLARVAFAGALTGITGITMAIVIIAAAATEGADADPVVSRAVTTAAAGPYFVAAMGFAVMLAAAGLLTLRTGVFARWTGIVALVGALSFLITFLALIQGTSEDSVFGYGFLPGILALTIWSIATSLAAYRAVATDRPLVRRAVFSALAHAAECQEPHAQPMQIRHEPVDHDRHGDRREHEGAEHGRQSLSASQRTPS